MTQMSLATAAELDRLAFRGWPAVETQQIGGWTARGAAGVTRRANSVLTSHAGAARADEATTDGTIEAAAAIDLDVAIDAVETFYRERGLTPTFQVSDASRPAVLAEALAQRGYRREGETVTQIASLSALRERLSAAMSPEDVSRIAEVAVTDDPDNAWLQMWWSVDGRGGALDLETARTIMVGSPALYAAVHDESGVSAGARLALLDDWGALFSLVVRPNARRQGLATRTLAALVVAAERRGVRRVCLQVLATSHGALAFYESLGFETASHYRYWVAPAASADR